jgi:hypothetical protein
VGAFNANRHDDDTTLVVFCLFGLRRSSTSPRETYTLAVITSHSTVFCGTGDGATIRPVPPHTMDQHGNGRCCGSCWQLEPARWAKKWPQADVRGSTSKLSRFGRARDTVPPLYELPVPASQPVDCNLFALMNCEGGYQVRCRQKCYVITLLPFLSTNVNDQGMYMIDRRTKNAAMNADPPIKCRCACVRFATTRTAARTCACTGPTRRGSSRWACTRTRPPAGLWSRP